MTETEKAYIAGLLDGEGCISIKRSRRTNYNLYVEIYNTNKDVMLWLQERYIGSINSKRKNVNHKVCYTWCVACSKAESFLELIIPYLIIKQEQAVIALEFQDNVIRTPGVRISKEELDHRESYKMQLSLLKEGKAS